MLARWLFKFRCAVSGLGQGCRDQDSFVVHLAMALVVLVLAAVVRPALWGWCLLVMCIALVISAELFNTAIEILVRRLHPDRDAEVGRALDVAAAAVLVASIGAAVVGVLVLGEAAWARFVLVPR